MSETYTLAELQAMDNSALNAMAAELRKLESVRCASGFGEIVEDWLCDTPTSVPLYRAADWSPTTDRNQSGELLEWLADQSFSMSIGRDHFGIVSVGISHSDYVTIGAHDKRWALAETVAFCAAMLAMEGRLK